MKYLALLETIVYYQLFACTIPSPSHYWWCQHPPRRGQWCCKFVPAVQSVTRGGMVLWRNCSRGHQMIEFHLCLPVSACMYVYWRKENNALFMHWMPSLYGCHSKSAELMCFIVRTHKLHRNPMHIMLLYTHYYTALIPVWVHVFLLLFSVNNNRRCS